MGILAPLYIAGLAALSLPIVLHLVRRTPRGRQLFSSLMFLRPTPPRLTQRSRLDQILLLLLRLTALALLAFAFCRPFLREAALLTANELPGRRVALLIDNSASLRRGDLWTQALRIANEELDQLGPNDDVALYTFNDRLRRVIEFDKPDSPATEAKPDVVRSALKDLSPAWSGTDLAEALVTVAGDLDVSTDVNQSTIEPHIVLISDLQNGSRTDRLQGYEWPEGVRVVEHRVSLPATTNGYARLLPSDEDAADADPRISVASAANSTNDQFHVGWSTATSANVSEAAVYVPPGQSRVVCLPRPQEALLADQVVLRGDDDAFDNICYVVPPRKETVPLYYFGDDNADDAAGVQYYLRLAVSGDPLRQVDVVTPPAEEPLPASAKLVVLSRPLPADQVSAFQSLAEKGATLVVVPGNREAAQTAASFIDATLKETPAPQPDSDDYLLLGQIDFTHSLFAPFANPRYSDFTKIHFWTHWPLALNDASAAKVVARFDNGDPAILERPLGSGRIIVFAATWRPDDSQLALSSKFVPLIGSLLNTAYGQSIALASVSVNDPVPLPENRTATVIVQKPDGREVTVEASATHFEDTDQPGVYRIRSGTDDFAFAVNLPSSESDTAPLNVEQLEQLGVRFGREETQTQRLEGIRQQRDIELESRQKIWRWMIALALAILIVETWLSGRAQRQPVALMEAVP